LSNESHSAVYEESYCVATSYSILIIFSAKKEEEEEEEVEQNIIKQNSHLNIYQGGLHKWKYPYSVTTLHSIEITFSINIINWQKF
jgi:hypothetical protein